MTNTPGQLSGKPAKKVDTSPKLREHFDPQQIGVAIGILIITAVAAFLLAIGLRTNLESDLKVATDRANATKAEYEQKLQDLIKTNADRIAELDAREAAIASRETTVKKREATLSEQETAFEAERDALTDEKALFYSDQSRIFELSRSLYEILAPYYETESE